MKTTGQYGFECYITYEKFHATNIKSSMGQLPGEHPHFTKYHTAKNICVMCSLQLQRAFQSHKLSPPNC